MTQDDTQANYLNDEEEAEFDDDNCDDTSGEIDYNLDTDNNSDTSYNDQLRNKVTTILKHTLTLTYFIFTFHTAIYNVLQTMTTMPLQVVLFLMATVAPASQSGVISHGCDVGGEDPDRPPRVPVQCDESGISL